MYNLSGLTGISTVLLLETLHVYLHICEAMVNLEQLLVCEERRCRGVAVCGRQEHHQQVCVYALISTFGTPVTGWL